MKKFYFLLLALAFASSALFSQSIQLSTTDGQILSNGSSINVIKTYADTVSDYFLELHMKNISSSKQDIKVERIDKVLPNAQKAYFCFAGFCYPSDVTVSPEPLSLLPGATDPNFSAHINPNMTTGNSVVYYKFFTVANPNDTVGIYVQTRLWHAGINDNASAAEMGLAYPNPANNMLSIDCRIPDGAKATLVLKNILGATVRELLLTSETDKVRMEVADLPEGIYFYVLSADGKNISTRKLMIRH